MDFGLCCLFYKEPINYKTYTITFIKKVSEKDPQIARKNVLDVILFNLNSLQKSLDYCYKNQIKGYRVSSNLIPHFTNIKKLKILKNHDWQKIKIILKNINTYNLILSFHPGQFVNLGSPRKEVIKSSVQDLKYHLWLAKYLKITEINIHLGGSYNNKKEAIKRFIVNFKKYIPERQQAWFTIENDELNYSVEEVLELSEILKLRITLDLHHHRCYQLKSKSKKTEQQLFMLCSQTWKKYNYQRVHLSSRKYLDKSNNLNKCRPHANYLKIEDIPKWLMKNKRVILDVEAKFKEVAIKKIQKLTKCREVV